MGEREFLKLCLRMSKDKKRFDQLSSAMAHRIIEQLRRRLSFAGIGHKLGVSAQYVHVIYSGKVKCGPERILKLAQLRDEVEEEIAQRGYLS